MKVVLDTNVLVAAFIAHGACHELLEHCAIRHDVVLSRFILDEFKGVLTAKFGFAAREADAALRLVRSRAVIVKPRARPRSISGDPDDDAVLATALSARADCLITGDKALLGLESVDDVPILSPGAFWSFEDKATVEPRRGADGQPAADS